jgi:hypothetical protein
VSIRVGQIRKYVSPEGLVGNVRVLEVSPDGASFCTRFSNGEVLYLVPVECAIELVGLFDDVTGKQFFIGQKYTRAPCYSSKPYVIEAVVQFPDFDALALVSDLGRFRLSAKYAADELKPWVEEESKQVRLPHDLIQVQPLPPGASPIYYMDDFGPAAERAAAATAEQFAKELGVNPSECSTHGKVTKSEEACLDDAQYRDAVVKKFAQQPAEFGLSYVLNPADRTARAVISPPEKVISEILNKDRGPFSAARKAAVVAALDAPSEKPFTPTPIEVRQLLHALEAYEDARGGRSAPKDSAKLAATYGCSSRSVWWMSRAIDAYERARSYCK